MHARRSHTNIYTHIHFSLIFPIAYSMINAQFKLFVYFMYEGTMYRKNHQSLDLVELDQIMIVITLLPIEMGTKW